MKINESLICQVLGEKKRLEFVFVCVLYVYCPTINPILHGLVLLTHHFAHGRGKNTPYLNSKPTVILGVSGLELHSSSTEPDKFFGAQCSTWGGKIFVWGGTSSGLGAHGPGMPAVAPGLFKSTHIVSKF